MCKFYFHLKTLLQSSKAALKFKALMLVTFHVPLLRLVCLPLEGLTQPQGPSEGLAWGWGGGGLLASNCSTYSLSLPHAHFLVRGRESALNSEMLHAEGASAGLKAVLLCHFPESPN